jgi:hypothetical protein
MFAGSTDGTGLSPEVLAPLGKKIVIEQSKVIAEQDAIIKQLRNDFERRTKERDGAKQKRIVHW